MWFKGLMLYRLTEQWVLTPDQLNEKLAEFQFHECGSLDPMKYGFEKPLGDHGSQFVHAANGYIMFCAKRQEKILPGGTINEELAKKIKAISDAESRPVGRKERDALKDEIIFSLLPKAFTRSSLDYAYIAPQEGLIVVNASSSKRAEDLLSKLREALGSLRCLPVAVKHIPSQVMTHWLRESQAPSQFELGQDVELLATKDGRTVNAKKLDLTSAELRNHLDSGMHVSKLSLIWKECIRFIVDDQLSIKSVKFEDAICDKANERNPESKAEQFDADFAIMTLELKNFIAALLVAFGGESEAQDLAMAAPIKPALQPKHADESPEQEGDDALLAEAMQFVITTRKASILSLQRHLRLGYNRAARLIEALESSGVVSRPAHNGERKVLVSP